MAHFMQDRYRKEVVSVLQREFSYANVMEVPRIRKAGGRNRRHHGHRRTEAGRHQGP
jgi:hypothetical protein